MKIPPSHPPEVRKQAIARAEEVGYQQAAVELDLPTNTVKSWQQRARAKLQSAVAEVVKDRSEKPMVERRDALFVDLVANAELANQGLRQALEGGNTRRARDLAVVAGIQLDKIKSLAEQIATAGASLPGLSAGHESIDAEIERLIQQLVDDVDVGAAAPPAFLREGMALLGRGDAELEAMAGVLEEGAARLRARVADRRPVDAERDAADAVTVASAARLQERLQGAVATYVDAQRLAPDRSGARVETELVEMREVPTRARARRLRPVAVEDGEPKIRERWAGEAGMVDFLGWRPPEAS